MWRDGQNWEEVRSLGESERLLSVHSELCFTPLSAPLLPNPLVPALHVLSSLRSWPRSSHAPSHFSFLYAAFDVASSRHFTSDTFSLKCALPFYLYLQSPFLYLSFHFSLKQINDPQPRILTPDSLTANLLLVFPLLQTLDCQYFQQTLGILLESCNLLPPLEIKRAVSGWCKCFVQ